jgi:NADPH-dependent glutamate synthase beta subunit-like oxidoreductase
VGNQNGVFSLTVAVGGGYTRTVFASRIDACTGTGPARRTDAKIASDDLRDEYFDTVPRRKPWPRIITGEDFLRERNLPPTHEQICVVGGGGTAALCVEAALRQGNHLWWVHRRGLDEVAFPASRRNHRLARSDEASGCGFPGAGGFVLLVVMK